jgi:hypothetical protein
MSDEGLRRLERSIECGRDFVRWLNELERRDPEEALGIEVQLRDLVRKDQHIGLVVGSWWWVKRGRGVASYLMPSSDGGSRWMTLRGRDEPKFETQDDLDSFVAERYLAHRRRPGLDSPESAKERSEADEFAWVPPHHSPPLNFECSTCGAPAGRLCGDSWRDFCSNRARNLFRFDPGG